MAVTRTLPDANVLHGRVLRDWLFLLNDETGGRAFRLCYTVDILAETIKGIRRARPDLTGDQITGIHDKIVTLMDERIDQYPAGTDAPVKDPFDRHVHAAAVAGAIDAVITSDTGFLGLPESEKDALRYEIYSPDEFFLLVDDSMPAHVMAVTGRQLAHFRSSGDSSTLSAKLRAAGCPGFAQRVQRHCIDLASH
ncbi:putative nucleic acid-binding protein [Naumannella cuiyingiana]|uniref:Putative nucleic acid-binding protein n=1 Tax=Naumannella cuiyingiana TaxID=1347891 RepID=A0A7Z0D9E7_9ACTN|nr:PIN domain-containing protein [Naumannella cuiyingiana]NYI71184.1 putative nucleic acid-binding protein [Naumannella cuiyingiana]